MKDKILEGFLRCQREEGMALADASDLLRLVPVDGSLQLYLAEFRARGLVQHHSGAVVEADRFAIGIFFPESYLRAADPFTVLTMLEPLNAFHPNISPRAPFICIGNLAAGTPLVDILYRCFEVISYQRVNMCEDNALNKPACAWARRNLHRFPVDRRSLKRLAVDFAVEPVKGTEASR